MHGLQIVHSHKEHMKGLTLRVQEVRSIQRKMKEIREKIATQSGGHQRAVSQWENWNP
jgi:hypothetical protein